MKNENIVRLLTIRESSNDAEAIASMMRNAGYAIRFTNIEDEEDLRSALDQQTWDLALSSLTLPEFSALQALSIIKESGKDIPLIVTVGSYDDQTALEVLKAGGREFILETNQELLLLVIARELADLEERRAHRHTKNLYLESERRNRALMDSSRDAIAYIHEGMHIHSNATYLETFGFTDPSDIEGIPMMDMIASEDQQKFKDILRNLNKGENPDKEFEFTAVREDGKNFKATMEFSSASIDGELCTQVIIRTKSDNKELEKALDSLRKQDLLTGLYNRHHFMTELESAVKLITDSETAKNSALIYIELDNYNSLVESIGIAASDLVLSDCASILRGHTSPADIVARYEGNVFTILLNEPDIELVKLKTEAIRHAIENHLFDVESKSISCTCSIGISQITETTADARKILSQANVACKAVKSNGGNGYHLHTAADEKASNERDQQWIQLIKTALEKDGFHLVYQPIVSLHAEPGERYEILLRMNDNEGQEIKPSEFLGVAEQAGIMSDIDRWVTKQAVKVLAAKRNTKVPLQFFIKISFDSLRNQTLLIWISKLLKAARLHGTCLTFEISEASALAALKETKIFVNGLKQLHCQFALDHVGSEGGSINYLKHLDAKYIKIDGSHITNLASSEQSQEMVKNIAEAARAQGKMIIAEHVQDANSLAILWQYGVNFIQGYYLQHPDKAMNYDFTSEN